MHAHQRAHSAPRRGECRPARSKLSTAIATKQERHLHAFERPASRREQLSGIPDNCSYPDFPVIPTGAVDGVVFPVPVRVGVVDWSG